MVDTYEMETIYRMAFMQKIILLMDEQPIFLKDIDIWVILKYKGKDQRCFKFLTVNDKNIWLQGKQWIKNIQSSTW